MANSETIKTTIDANINTNGNQAITGAVMNSVLKQMVDSTDAELAKLSEEIKGVAETIVIVGRQSNEEDLKLKAHKLDKVEFNAYKKTNDSILESQNKEIEQFKEVVTEQINEYQPIQIVGNVTNAADEEDLTSESNLLKLKNRNALNGMGYVILRKNKTFAEQLSLANTIYEIRYDFDLEQNNVQIPSNCILKFNGGSLRNGKIQGDNTSFEGLYANCLLVDFAGTFGDISINADVVGLVAENSPLTNQQSAFDRLSHLICGTKNVHLQFNNGFYGFGGGGKERFHATGMKRGWWNKYALDIQNHITESLTIVGNKTIFKNLFPYYIGAWDFTKETPSPVYTWKKETESTKQQIGTSGGGFFNLFSYTPVDLTFKDFEVDSNRDIMQFGGYQNWTQEQNGFTIVANGGHVILDGIKAHGNVTDGFLAQNAKTADSELNLDSLRITNCDFYDNIRGGCNPCAGKLIHLSSCRFKDNGRFYYIKGYKFEGAYLDIDIEPNPKGLSAVENVIIEDCHFVNSNNVAIYSDRQKVKTFDVRGCSFYADKGVVVYKDVTTGGIEDYEVVETSNFPKCFNVAGVIDSIDIDNINVSDYTIAIPSLGEYPTTPPLDTTKEQYYYSTFEDVPNKLTRVGTIIYEQRLSPVVFESICPLIHNYVWNVAQQSWAVKYHYLATEPDFPYYGRTYIENVVVNIKTPCVVLKPAGEPNHSFSIINNLTITFDCLYSGVYIFGSAIQSEKKYNTRVNNLVINDIYNGVYDGLPITQPTYFESDFFVNVEYRKLLGEQSGIRFQNGITDIAFAWFVNKIQILNSDKSKYRGDIDLYRNPSIGASVFSTVYLYIYMEDGSTIRKNNFMVYWNGTYWEDAIKRKVAKSL